MNMSIFEKIDTLAELRDLEMLCSFVMITALLALSFTRNRMASASEHLFKASAATSVAMLIIMFLIKITL